MKNTHICAKCTTFNGMLKINYYTSTIKVTGIMKNSQLLIIISNDMKKTKLAVGSIRK